MTVHPLDEVRGNAEETHEKARWTLIVREHIAHTLVKTGYFSAEDLDSLGVPDQHVNVCTSWIGHYSKCKLMKKLSWRYSDKPSRKGGIVWTFQITDEGRSSLPKLLTDIRAEIAGFSVDNREGIAANSQPDGTLDRPDALTGSADTSSGALQQVGDADSGDLNIDRVPAPKGPDRQVPASDSPVDAPDKPGSAGPAVKASPAPSEPAELLPQPGLLDPDVEWGSAA